MTTDAGILSYIDRLMVAIDNAKYDLWGTGMTEARTPIDNYGRIHDRQSKRAEIWDAIISYRNEDIEFADLLSFLQSFDRTVTVADVLELLGDKYHG